MSALETRELTKGEINEEKRKYLLVRWIYYVPEDWAVGSTYSLSLPKLASMASSFCIKFSLSYFCFNYQLNRDEKKKYFRAETFPCKNNDNIIFDKNFRVWQFL